MKSFWYVCAIVTAVLLPIYLSGCGGSDGGSVADGPTTGRLSISVTDAPVDGASSVFVEFTGVEIQSSTGERLNFDYSPGPPRQINLLALSGGGSEGILDDVEIDAGHYEWIRLKVNAECDTLDSYIVFGDDPPVSYSMSIPSGDQTGLKLNRGFDMPAGGAVNFTVDFDLRKSVNYSQGGGQCADVYKLRPTLRIVDNTKIGSISGTVADGTLTDDSCADGDGDAVYVFEGSGIIPDDIDTSIDTDIDPITTAMVDVVDIGGGVLEGKYRVDFLRAGVYTLAFTCQSDSDLPGSDESIVFLGETDVIVTEGVETIQNF